MELIPKELLREILLYSDENEHRNLMAVTDHKLNEIDYLYLLRGKYPLYYTPDITKYNIESLYLGLLLIDSIIKTENDTAEVPKYVQKQSRRIFPVSVDSNKGVSNPEDVLKLVINKLDTEFWYELYRYLLSEILILSKTDIYHNDYYIEPIYKNDDIQTFIKFVE